MRRFYSPFILLFLLCGCAKDDFKWSKDKVGKIATLEIVDLNQTNSNSFLVEGTVVWDGDSPIDSVGFCFSESSNPTILDIVQYSNLSNGKFIKNISGLQANKRYYIRAFAKNGAGISYSQEITLQTLIFNNGVPIILTVQVDSISQHTVISRNEVANESGYPVTSRGVCYATTPNPTVSNNVAYSGSGPGVFDVPLSGLQSGTTYYLRAYAENQTGIAYGNELTFTTLQPVSQLATVVTNSVSDFGSNYVVAGGNVLNSGNTVFVRGVCYSTTPLPEITDNYVSIGQGAGIFSDTVFNLLPATTYYLRAYATNQVGTSYGNQVSFTTSPGPPVLSSPINNVTIPCCYFDFKWNCILNASSYDIQVSTVQGFIAAAAPFPWASNSAVLTANTLMEANVSDNCNQNVVTTALIGTGNATGIFYWRVRARFGNNIGAWSNVQTFVRN